MTSLLDGVAIDLDRVQVTLDGSRWLWTCDINESGQPIMQRLSDRRLMPLTEVYGHYGPLTPDAQRTTAAMCQQILTGWGAS
jgi:hypothetical protein